MLFVEMWINNNNAAHPKCKTVIVPNSEFHLKKKQEQQQQIKKQPTW